MAQWIKKATRKKGVFKAQARRAGYSNTFSYARAVVKSPGKHSKKTAQRARLALQLEKFQKRKKVNSPRRTTEMARRRRRRPARRSTTRRRRNAGFLPGRLGPIGKLLAAAVGYALAEIPMIDEDIGETGIKYAAIVGAILLLKGRGDAMRFVGLGLALNGGVAPAVSKALAPVTSKLAAA